MCTMNDATTMLQYQTTMVASPLYPASTSNMLTSVILPTASHSEATSKWAAYQLQQLQQRFSQGKSLKDGSDGDKKEGDSDGLWSAMEAQAAFLGPNIWDKNLAACDSDLKVGAQVSFTFLLSTFLVSCCCLHACI
ncbi:hypothetical protein B566_EDAN012943 [Ephemera danica]|nr:hypothetical protein B566_EDAN012943 [Ephemera danica]